MLLSAHPELLVEAYDIAAGLLVAVDPDAVAENVMSALLELDMEHLANRADRHRGGYVEPNEATWALVEEAAAPSKSTSHCWARLLYERGVDVMAYDASPPPPSSDSQWFARVTPWYPVARDDGRVVTEHADRTLLLVWPTRDESWAARAAIDFHTAGGRSLVYVGEGPGGPTGDDELHALRGHHDRCLACAHALVDRPCICGVGQPGSSTSPRSCPTGTGWRTICASTSA